MSHLGKTQQRIETTQVVLGFTAWDNCAKCEKLNRELKLTATFTPFNSFLIKSGRKTQQRIETDNPLVNEISLISIQPEKLNRELK